MIVSHKHRYVFVSTPKAATNSMYSWLKTYWAGEHVPGLFHGREIPPECEGYFTFTCCRNPYSRAVSIWNSTIKARHAFRLALGEISLPDFLRWAMKPGHGRDEALCWNQATWLAPVADRLDNIIKLEDLSVGLPLAVSRFRGAVLGTMCGLGRENATMSSEREYESHLTPEVIRLVNEWAEPDFDRFQYPRA